MADSVNVEKQVFARLVGNYPDDDLFLFLVTTDALTLVDESDQDGWSDPVLLRFVRRQGASVELEFKKLDKNRMIIVE